MEKIIESKGSKEPIVESKGNMTFGRKLLEKLKLIGIGCSKAIIFLGIIATQSIRWTLKLIIWPIPKLVRNIYCRMEFRNEDENMSQENSAQEKNEKTGKSSKQKVLVVIKELGMFVGGYVFSALRRIFISDVCGLYNIARNKSFFGNECCYINSFCDDVGFDVSGYYCRVDSHQGDNWGCSDSNKFHFADYLRYVSGYSDVLDKDHDAQDSIIRKIECCCLSEDSPEMYC